MIYLKSSYDIEAIKQAAMIYKKVKIALIAHAKVNVNLNALDALANEVITKAGATAAFYHYRNFPKHICISINQALIHGIPDNYIIQPGDSITFDIGVKYKNHYCDAAFTMLIPPISKEAKNIDYATQTALTNAINVVRAGVYTSDIGRAVQTTAKKFGYEVIKDFGGHGCGNKLHEDPIVYNYESNRQGTKLIENMIICIEPMLMTNSDQYYIDPKNQWTVIAKNQQLTCHYEHMVLIKKDGCEVLTA